MGIEKLAYAVILVVILFVAGVKAGFINPVLLAFGLPAIIMLMYAGYHIYKLIESGAVHWERVIFIVVAIALVYFLFGR